MAISFTQTDTNAVCTAAVYCSLNILNSTTSLKQAAEGGTPGTVAVSQSIDKASTGSNLIAAFFECIVASGIIWNAGTWTVNLDVTTLNASLTWTFLDICRISSGCVNQASIASGSLSISLGTTGVKTTTIAGSVQTPSAGDKVMVLLGFTNSTGTAKTFGYTPDVTIDSPFSRPTPANSLMLMGVGI